MTHPAQHTENDMNTNYETMAKRIRACKSREELDRISTSLDGCYGTGILTARELARLDGVWVDTLIKADEDTHNRGID